MSLVCASANVSETVLHILAKWTQNGSFVFAYYLVLRSVLLVRLGTRTCRNPSCQDWTCSLNHPSWVVHTLLGGKVVQYVWYVYFLIWWIEVDQVKILIFIHYVCIYIWSSLFWMHMEKIRRWFIWNGLRTVLNEMKRGRCHTNCFRSMTGMKIVDGEVGGGA